MKERRKGESNPRDVRLRQGFILTGEKEQFYVNVEAAKGMGWGGICTCPLSGGIAGLRFVSELAVKVTSHMLLPVGSWDSCKCAMDPDE